MRIQTLPIEIKIDLKGNKWFMYFMKTLKAKILLISDTVDFEAKNIFVNRTKFIYRTKFIWDLICQVSLAFLNVPTNQL